MLSIDSIAPVIEAQRQDRAGDERERICLGLVGRERLFEIVMLLAGLLGEADELLRLSLEAFGVSDLLAVGFDLLGAKPSCRRR
ncbi:MAG: hypothetical protein MZW92_12455 [Comamonadaceae bacterium]|nr:hypothetical protein [Comamonadaceae bacterium]